MVYSIKVPSFKQIRPKKNLAGYNLSDYRGTPTTLCGGCGHDSISTAIMLSCYELSLEPHNIVKLSGIGCSSKTPSYFVSGAHAFNSIHGRMPCVATGACAAHNDLNYIAVSGDGDTSCIGLGHFIHAIKRQINICYIVENNGVFGLTKGQFSGTADLDSKNKRGESFSKSSIDLPLLALQMGANFVARSFSGDKDQLIKLIKSAMTTPGFALIDVLSPCVSFNNHEGSTKSYFYIRENTSILSEQNDRFDAIKNIIEVQLKNKIPLGLFFKDEVASHFHKDNQTVACPLRNINLSNLCPGDETLDNIMRDLR